MCAHAHLYLTLCDLLDCSPPGSSVHEIFQARVLGWVAMSSSNSPTFTTCVFVSLCSTPGTVSVLLVSDFTKSKQTGWTVFGEAKPSVPLIHSWIYSCSKYLWADHSVPGSVLGTKGKISKQSKFEKSLLFRGLTLLLRDITKINKEYIYLLESNKHLWFPRWGSGKVPVQEMQEKVWSLDQEEPLE